ncbi:MAG: hypothetical protein KDM91_15405, partial [Verrucomicrobiae bacterium]|nr:hypothetical protein [Verrucomicrobiae bacterium]
MRNRTRITSYDNATPGAGVVLNQVAHEHDDFGQLTADRQAHSGAVVGATPAVTYTYEDGSLGNTARRTAVVYPDGRKITLGYGATGGASDRLSRVETLKIFGDSLDTAAYTFVGASRYVRIAYPVPGVERTYLKGATEPVGDAGDPYTGF